MDRHYIFQNNIILGTTTEVFGQAASDVYFAKDDVYQFGRHLHLLTEYERRSLEKSTIAVVGVGGVGAVAAERLARIGVGNIRIADHDAYVASNLNRQFGSGHKVLNRSKADVIREIILDINPSCHVLMRTDGVDEESVCEFVEGADVILQCHDHAETIRMIQAKARSSLSYVIAPRISGWVASCAVLDPSGNNFADYFRTLGLPDDPELSFFTNASIGIPCTIAGSMAASFAVQAITEDHPSFLTYPLVYEFDCRRMQLRHVDVFDKTKRLKELVSTILRNSMSGAEVRTSIEDLLCTHRLSLSEDEIQYVLFCAERNQLRHG